MLKALISILAAVPVYYNFAYASPNCPYVYQQKLSQYNNNNDNNNKNEFSYYVIMSAKPTAM